MKAYKEFSDSVLSEYDSARGDNNTYWEAHWQNQDFIKSIKKAMKSHLGELSFLKKYARSGDRVLEAGCGKGQIVAALSELGIESYGIDNTKMLIKAVKKEFPQLKLYYADLSDIPFNNKYFDIYLSFGVIEHYDDKNKLETLFMEAKRVTSRYCFFSVPFYSPALKRRWLKNKLLKNITGKEFYQYYFDKKAITNLLEQFGLKTIDFIYYATAIGLHRNNQFASFLWDKFPFFKKLLVKSSSILNFIIGIKYAHMIGVWCEIV